MEAQRALSAMKLILRRLGSRALTSVGYSLRVRQLPVDWGESPDKLRISYKLLDIVETHHCDNWRICSSRSIRQVTDAVTVCCANACRGPVHTSLCLVGNVKW